MKVFIQGMRRSGTTILFDALAADAGLDLYYEPFAAANRPATGGGSGARDIDFFDKIRAVRKSFTGTQPATFDPALLNYGAPRDAALEFARDLPQFCRDYLRFMLDRSPDTVIKFTRMCCKLAALAEVEPGAKVIHVVRDPRAVATSYLFGKNRRNARLYPTEQAFFDRTSNYTAWSSGPLSECILKMPDYHEHSGCADFIRILLIWAFTFRTTRADGLEHFGGNYRLLRHEDLANDPARTLRSVYEYLQRPMPSSVLEWATANIRPVEEPFAADNPRWVDAARRLDLNSDLSTAGYRWHERVSVP